MPGRFYTKERYKMFEKQFHISMLIALQMRAEITPQQQQELDDWISANEHNREWYKMVTHKEQLPLLLANYYDAHEELVWAKTANKINAAKGKTVIPAAKANYRLWYQITAAAILLIIGAIAFLTWNYTGHRTPNSVGGLTAENDIAPGKNSATLTLASGRKIKLSDAINGELAKEAGVSINKTKNGQIVYTVTAQGKTQSKPSADDISYNLISTAKGEMYQVILPDQSVVWLNAASSLKYPASFANLKERKVILDGEAYFQVTHNAKQPFRVQTAAQLIEDIGTAFNVNSYSDEPGIKTTLVEGSVRINNNTLLKPGEQAMNSGNSIKVLQVDTETATGWKDGDFVFKETDFKTAMRKIARWYNVEVIYHPGIGNDIELGGWISRKNNLSAVLKWIESTNNIHFKVEGRRITVVR
ncbi:DUF4974 domain-containing protein [Pedobacter sp. MC2016-14]|uniref:FecR family protein n=1 Tax=Pedobacter sp. MC2016-14 TaxID=2897327 RepID=UPI001E3823D1|nr:FecR family protein [Pedobacter sp. MC2016-14]MCD0490421.1 DUF4974 domain-containing protein [Pedobacter sp. MC2016-14]